MTLDKLLCLSGPLFPHLYNKNLEQELSEVPSGSKTPIPHLLGHAFCYCCCFFRTILAPRISGSNKTQFPITATFRVPTSPKHMAVWMPARKQSERKWGMSEQQPAHWVCPSFPNCGAPTVGMGNGPLFYGRVLCLEVNYFGSLPLQSCPSLLFGIFHFWCLSVFCILV